MRTMSSHNLKCDSIDIIKQKCMNTSELKDNS